MVQMGTTTINSQEQICFPKNILRWDVSDGQVWRTSDVVRRTDPSDGKSKLYDKKITPIISPTELHLLRCCL